jgi:chromosome segregation ATPase
LEAAGQQFELQKKELEAAQATIADLTPKLEKANEAVQAHLATIQATTQLINNAGGEKEIEGIKEKIAHFELQIKTIQQASQQQEEASTKKLQELTEAHGAALEEKVQALEVATNSVAELKTKLLASQQETTEATEQGNKSVEQIQQQLTAKEEEATKLVTQVEQLTLQLEQAKEASAFKVVDNGDVDTRVQLETAKAALIGARQILKDLDKIDTKQTVKAFKKDQANFVEVLAKIEEVLNEPAPKTTTPIATSTNTSSTSTTTTTGNQS